MFDAVDRLAQRQPDDITVAQVVRESGISRSTFYAHFSGMEELAAGYLNRAFRRLGQAEQPAVQRAPREACRVLIGHMVDTVPLYASVMGLPLRGRAVDRMLEGYAAQFARILDQVPERPPGADPGMLGAYLAGGTLAAVRRRRRVPEQGPDVELVDEVLALLPDWLA